MRDDAVLGRALPLDRGLGPDISSDYGMLGCHWMLSPCLRINGYWACVIPLN